MIFGPEVPGSLDIDPILTAQHSNTIVMQENAVRKNVHSKKLTVCTKTLTSNFSNQLYVYLTETLLYATEALNTFSHLIS